MTVGAATSQRSVAWALCGLGLCGLMIVFLTSSTNGSDAVSQSWSPFVLVTGLLLVGFVANEDGIFSTLGAALARATRSPVLFFLGASFVVTIVTAVLNLDTAVAFLTPILIFASRSRGVDEAPLLYGTLMLSNGASLFLPGSNLTNLIVLGHEHVSGASFLSHMWAPATAAVIVIVVVLLVSQRRFLTAPTLEERRSERVHGFVGATAIVAVTFFVLLFRSPALVVFGVGLVAVAVHLVTTRSWSRRPLEVLGLPTLIGLFGIAVTLGTLGRVWSGPATLLHHLNIWGSGYVAGATSVIVNNLPAAALLSARAPTHPFATLVGLNLGPNLGVTGSLAWLLWLRSSRLVGAAPSLRRASTLGVFVAPLSITVALGALSLAGH